MQRIGSSKVISPVEPGVVAFEFTDNWSAFDRGTSPQPIPKSGAARCACAVRSFKLAKAANVETHFIEQVSPTQIHVKECAIPGQRLLSGHARGRVLPLEWIERTLAYGSLIERIRAGTIHPVSLGFPRGVEVTPGMRLPRPVTECTTKFEPVDRHLTPAEARMLADLSLSEWDEIWNLVIEAANMTTAAYGLAGFVRPDGKKEVAFTPNGFMLVDVFGTPDEDRLIDAKTGEIYSKDLKRNYLKALPWYQELQAAKAAYPTNKDRWPPYPTFPDDFVELDSQRYVEVARRYAHVNV